jgi:hypothetical protein
MVNTAVSEKNVIIRIKFTKFVSFLFQGTEKYSILLVTTDTISRALLGLI